MVSAAVAQESTGTISGAATDPSGAVVPQAEIIVTNVQTGVARNGHSNSGGLFVLTNLAVGNYTLTAKATRFQKV